jgi:hypothetical protein
LHGSDAGGGEGLDRLSDGITEHRVIGLEADLGCPEGLDETGMVLGGNIGPEAALDGGDEAHQFGPVLVPFPRAFDGGGKFLQESPKIVFHARNDIAVRL